jgi:competence protein ComEA
MSSLSAPSAFLSARPRSHGAPVLPAPLNTWRVVLRSARAALLGLCLGLVGTAAMAAADANKAALEDLRTVKGIGPSIAERILDERKKGSFKDWPDFIGRIKGIGDGNAAKFSANGLTINGAAYAGGAAVAGAAAAKPGRPGPAVADAAAKPVKP